MNSNPMTTNTCTCGNHYTVLAGDTCEICMGIVPTGNEEPVSKSMFDMAYFEALESYYAQIEYAS